MINKLDSHLEAYTGNSIYDFDNEIMLKWYARRIVSINPNAESILELGLGHGFSTRLFSEHYTRHVVLDGSKAVTENFKAKNPECGAEIVETYFEEFETPEKFDMVVMGFVLEHVDNPCLIIERYKQFLKPSGKMYISVPNAEVLNRRLGNLAGMLPDMLSLSENDHLLGHKRYYTVQSLSDDIKKSGCAIERMEGIYLKPFTTGQMISLGLDEKVIEGLCEIGISYPELSCGILSELTELK